MKIKNYHLTSIKIATIEKIETNKQSKKKPQKITSVVKDMEKLAVLSNAGRNVKQCSCYGKQYGSYWKIKNRITI